MSAATKDMLPREVKGNPRTNELVEDFFADSDDEGLSVSTGTALQSVAPAGDIAKSYVPKRESPRPSQDDDDDVEVLLDVGNDKKRKVCLAYKDDDVEIVEPAGNVAKPKAPPGPLASSKQSSMLKPSTSKTVPECFDVDDDDDEEPTDELEDACDFGFDDAFLDGSDVKGSTLPPVGTKASGDCGAGLKGHGQLLARKMAALQKSILDADFKEMAHRNFLECQNSFR